MQAVKYPTETQAFMWYCGDESCECSQPVIEKWSYREDWLGRRTLIDRKRIWEGQFHSEAEPDERAEQLRELAAECKRRGLPIPAEAADRVG